jgi:flagellar motor component MotA
MEWVNVVAILVTAFAAIFAGSYFSKFKLLVKELKEAFLALDEVLQDDEVTVEELKRVVKEFRDILLVFLRK